MSPPYTLNPNIHLPKALKQALIEGDLEQLGRLVKTIHRNTKGNDLYDRLLGVISIMEATEDSDAVSYPVECMRAALEAHTVPRLLNVSVHLLNAIRKKHDMMVPLLLEKFDYSRDCLNQCLVEAIWVKRPQIVQSLIKQGANLNENNEPAWFAALRPRTSHLLPQLFEWGAKIEARSDYLYSTALHYWVSMALKMQPQIDQPCPHALSFLIKQGIAVDALDQNRKTALMLAQEKGRQDLVLMMEERVLSHNTPIVSRHPKPSRL